MWAGWTCLVWAATILLSGIHEIQEVVTLTLDAGSELILCPAFLKCLVIKHSVLCRIWGPHGLHLSYREPWFYPHAAQCIKVWVVLSMDMIGWSIISRCLCVPGRNTPEGENTFFFRSFLRSTETARSTSKTGNETFCEWKREICVHC